MIIKGIKNVILAALAKAGVNKSNFAESLEISEKTFKRLLETEDVKKLETFIDLCKILKVSPLDFLFQELYEEPFLRLFKTTTVKPNSVYATELFFYKSTDGVKGLDAVADGEEEKQFLFKKDKGLFVADVSAKELQNLIFVKTNKFDQLNYFLEDKKLNLLIENLIAGFKKETLERDISMDLKFNRDLLSSILFAETLTHDIPLFNLKAGDIALYKNVDIYGDNYYDKCLYSGLAYSLIMLNEQLHIYKLRSLEKQEKLYLSYIIKELCELSNEYAIISSLSKDGFLKEAENNNLEIKSIDSQCISSQDFAKSSNYFIEKGSVLANAYFECKSPEYVDTFANSHTLLVCVLRNQDNH